MAFTISSVTGGVSGRVDRRGMPLRSPLLDGRRRECLASSEMTSPTLRCCWVAIAFAAIRTSSSIAKVVLISASSRINHHASYKASGRPSQGGCRRDAPLRQSVHLRKRLKSRSQMCANHGSPVRTCSRRRVGTLDVDLGLDAAALGDGGYALIGNGFVQGPT